MRVIGFVFNCNWIVSEEFTLTELPKKNILYKILQHLFLFRINQKIKIFASSLIVSKHPIPAFLNLGIILA